MAILFGYQDSNTPTYDLSDLGVDEDDLNIHSGSLIFDKMNKRRIFHRRHHYN